MLVYPADGVVMPANVASLEPQWTHDPSHDLFELRIESEVARVRVLTDGDAVFLGGELAWIVQSQVGRSFAIYVRSASSAAPSEIFRSNTVTVRMTRSSIDGTAYFGQMAQPAVVRARFSDDHAEQRYPPFSDVERCTGCHALSRDGRRLAVSRGRDRLRMFALDGEGLRPENMEHKFEAGAFSPGASRFVHVDEGRLRILDVDADRVAGDIALPPMTFATHPDWAPDGRFIVFTYATDEKPEKYEFERTSIARVTADGRGGFGAPEVLVPAGGDSLGYPSISWDGRWIAYVRVEGDDGRRPQATIEVIPADASAPPIVLANLDERVGTSTRSAIRNIIPTWLPTASADERWLAFSSVRAYGHRLAEGERAQLWVSAFDPRLADAGSDPTSPAFWVTFQSPNSWNYRLQMAVTDFDVCASIVEVCNGVDDDCDEEVDEGCCQPGPMEICGNLLDDDCNGLVDDACACDGPEICGNGLDDDCDRKIDDDGC